MVERWLQSKPNPYMNNTRKVVRRVTPTRPFYSAPIGNPFVVNRKPIVRRTPPTRFGKMTAARLGVPIQLFKDSDRDGVANVFDCKPFNKRKQDVMHPQNFGSGVGDMYSRQEYARQQREYQRMLKEMQKQEEQRIAELQRIQGETIVVDNTRTIYQDTPYVFDVTGTKLVPANSAEGKAGIAKLQSLAKSESPTTTTTTTKVYSGPVRPSDDETTFRTTGVSTGGKSTTTTSSSSSSGTNALTKLLTPSSNALTKAITSYQNKTTTSAPAPAPKQNIVQKAVSSVKSFFSGGSKSSGKK